MYTKVVIRWIITNETYTINQGFRVVAVLFRLDSWPAPILTRNTKSEHHVAALDVLHKIPNINAQ